MLLLVTFRAFCDFPEIKSISPSDTLFAQLQRDISSYYKAAEGNGTVPSLVFYQYTPRPGEDILSISAKLSLNYDTIVSLNDISSINESLNKTLIIPNTPGLFIRQKPVSEFDSLLFANRDFSKDNYSPITLNIDGKKVKFHVIPGGKLNPRERAFFLGAFFRKPLSGGRLSSKFGLRLNPFTGISSFHHGLDIVVPTGTPVAAAAPGKVIKKGYDPIYGFYIELFHEPYYQTFYGHLNSTAVVLNQEVSSGTIIGTVGSTGQSTGPHLHFEIKRNNTPVNPENYF
jgi:murein DD-endopeptidase MepM/ murein hydrolase activator NlpD